MFSLDLEQSCFLELIKAAVFDINPDFPDGINWQRVFEIAQTQCVVPLVAYYVPKETRGAWIQLSYQSKAHYMQMLYEQDSLVSILKSKEIPFVILKGTAAGIYYPVPSLRTYGDIDFYVPDSSYKIAETLLKENGYDYITKNDRQSVYCKNGIEFELHNRISRDENSINDIVVKELNTVDCHLGKSFFPCLPSNENGLVLLWHIMHHLKFSGIGFRQIIDWMLFVHKELDDNVWENHFRSLALEAGLEKLAITVTYMCKKWLGLTDEITWCDKADEEVADLLLARIFYDGNFGGERFLFESIKLAIRNEGLFRYLQRAGMENWKSAQKHVVLRPFAWFYQLCRFAYKGTLMLIKGKKVFIKDKHETSLKELRQRLE